MKILKKYLLALAALVFVFLGAAMPYLVSRVQDARLSGFQKNSDLSSVSLTIQQEMENAVSAMDMISNEYTETSWEGKTVLTKELALQAAFKALEAMDKYDLLPGTVANAASTSYDGDKTPAVRTVSRSDASEETLEPLMLMDENGKTSLIWVCTWRFDDYSITISVDDATGKAVRVVINNLAADFDLTLDNITFHTEHWAMFLQDYYGGCVVFNEQANDSAVIRKDDEYDYSYDCDIGFAPDDSSELYYFTLKMASDYTLFNYK